MDTPKKQPRMRAERGPPSGCGHQMVWFDAGRRRDVPLRDGRPVVAPE